MTRGRPLLVLMLFMVAGLSVLVWILLGQSRQFDDSVFARSDDGRMSIHIFVPSPLSMKSPSANDDFVLKTIEDKFNVRLRVESRIPGNDYNAAIEEMLLANNPPDMWIDRSSDGASKLALDGVLADMTSFVSPLTMPNYFKYWANEKELRQYTIHNRFYRAPVPYDKNVYRSYYIRRDWLERLELEIPRTYDNYLNVLRAFTFDDPDGNGKDDTYGFTTSGNNSSLSTDWPEYVKNGLIYPAYMENNKLVDMTSDLRIGQVVDDILKVINEGVVDPDWFFNSGTDHIDKAVQGIAGIVLGESVDFALDANPASLQSRTGQSNPEADWVPFNPLGDQPLRAGVSPEYPFVFSKMTADKHPEKMKKIAEILDWLAGEEGFLLTHYGIEGAHYARSGNAITLLSRNEEGLQRSLGDMNIWTFFTPETPSVLNLQVIDPALTNRDKEIKSYLARMPVKQKLGTALTPPVGIDVAAFRSRQNELQVKMLFSDQSGAQWPAYYEELMSQHDGYQIIRNFEKQVKDASKE